MSDLWIKNGIQKKDIILRQDGNKWFATRGDFVNLQESIAYWGETPELALSKLLTQPSCKN